MIKKTRGPALAIAACLFALAFAAGLAIAATSGTWVDTAGSMSGARQVHTATLLANGKVLVAGGWVSSNEPSAELYDPASGTWSDTGMMITLRKGHTATLLANGKVLAVGGTPDNSAAFSSAELYDPVSGMWSEAKDMSTPRKGHTATLLADGRVLVVGGTSGASVYLSSAEIYDPVAGTWSTTRAMSTARSGHTATLLTNGKVLVVGGNDDSVAHSSAELYDPISGTWSATGSMSTARTLHTATLLTNGGNNDGKVLVVGGWQPGYLASVELYDPVAGTWSTTGSMKAARISHTATLLANGEVLVAGGFGSYPGYLSSAEVYNPASGMWSTTASMSTPRRTHTATLLANGRVLVAGGTSGEAILSTSELYSPGYLLIGTALTGSSGTKITTYYGLITVYADLKAGTKPLPGMPVFLEYSSNGSTGWTRATATITQPPISGRYQTSVRRTITGYYRFRFAGSATYGPAVGPVIKVYPKAYLTNPVAPTTVYGGKSFTTYGYLKPRHTAGTYPVRIYKYRYVSGVWKSYGYVTAKASNYSTYSKYTKAFSLSYTGKWRLRAYAPADSGHAATWSSGYDYVTVKDIIESLL